MPAGRISELCRAPGPGVGRAGDRWAWCWRSRGGRGRLAGRAGAGRHDGRPGAGQRRQRSDGPPGAPRDHAQGRPAHRGGRARGPGAGALSASIGCRSGSRSAGRRIGSPDRVRDFVVWERDTIQPKYGLPYGVEYTHDAGRRRALRLRLVLRRLPPRRSTPRRPRCSAPGLASKVVVYPAAGASTSGTRATSCSRRFPNGWNDEHRGYASFLPDTEPIYPQPRTLRRGRRRRARSKAWIEREDFQILRNLRRLPACLGRPRGAVPRADHGPGADRPRRPDAGDPLRERLPLARLRGKRVYDPRDHGLDRARAPTSSRSCSRYLTGQRASAGRDGDDHRPRSPACRARRRSRAAGARRPGRHLLPRLDADHRRRPAPIYRANRMMRGAAVPAGQAPPGLHLRTPLRSSSAAGSRSRRWRLLGVLGGGVRASGPVVRPARAPRPIRAIRPAPLPGTSELVE